jgi:predicted lipopolysaccharide heptosyltransferase III
LRILLIQLRRLGDLILTTPAIAALRHRYPDAHVTLAITRECEPLLPAISGIDDAFIVKRGVRGAELSRKRHYDCVIDFTGNDRSAWLTFRSGARQRILSDQLKRKFPLRARFYNEFAPCAMKEMHTIDYNLAFLRPLGIAQPPPEPVLDLPGNAHEQASSIVSNEIDNQAFAIFHSGSTRPEKFWEPDRWAKAIAFVKHELKRQPVLTSGNSPAEQAHVVKVRSHLSVPVIDLTGRLELLTLAALISRARLLVTVDSAPTHLASATKTPQVVLFGPTNPFHWRPRTSPAVVLFGKSPPFKRRERKLPMNQISTESVIDAIRSLQTAPAASAV